MGKKTNEDAILIKRLLKEGCQHAKYQKNMESKRKKLATGKKMK